MFTPVERTIFIWQMMGESMELGRDASMSRSRVLDTSRGHATPVSLHHSVLSEHDKSDDTSLQKDSAKKRYVYSKTWANTVPDLENGGGTSS